MATDQDRRAELQAIFTRWTRSEVDGIFDIGGLSPADLRRLNWGVKHGLVEKAQRPWPWISVGTCIKTHYRLIATP